MVTSGRMGTPLPCTASHEGTGTAIAIGSSVQEFKRGDRVMAGLPRDRCGQCTDCVGPDKLKHYCKNIKGYVGVTLDGAFAEYMVVDARESSKIPDSVPFETAAPLACAGVTVWGGLLRAELKAGETVALVGAGGGLGHIGCQFAKAMGLRVVGIDARDEAMELARGCGADVVLDAREGEEKVVEEVKKVTNGEGADATINLSDASTAAGLACAVTKMHGLMVQIAQVSRMFNHYLNPAIAPLLMLGVVDALANIEISSILILITAPRSLHPNGTVHIPRHPRPRLPPLLPHRRPTNARPSRGKKHHRKNKPVFWPVAAPAVDRSGAQR